MDLGQAEQISSCLYSTVLLENLGRTKIDDVQTYKQTDRYTAVFIELLPQLEIYIICIV